MCGITNPWLHSTLVLTLAPLIDNFNDNRHLQFVLKTTGAWRCRRLIFFYRVC